MAKKNTETVTTPANESTEAQAPESSIVFVKSEEELNAITPHNDKAKRMKVTHGKH
jgi:hypothetical protein